MDEKTLEGGGVSLKHIQFEEWVHYLNGDLDESVRLAYEEHLYECDHCLEQYMKAMEVSTIEIPDISHLTDSIMKEVNSFKEKDKKPLSNTSTHKQIVTHYILAAAMTILLMATGVFSQLMNVTSVLAKTESNESQSFVQSILENQESIIDKFEQRLKGVDKNE